MKKTNKYYLIKNKEKRDYNWLSIVNKNGTLVMEYNLVEKEDVTKFMNKASKIHYVNQVRSAGYGIVETTHEEAFLMLL